jgi:hypothetical protein
MDKVIEVVSEPLLASGDQDRKGGFELFLPFGGEFCIG